MSMHLKPLTPIEEEGLRAHGLPVGKPSQLADAFRLGMSWADKACAAPWKSAVIDQLVIGHILTAEHESNPLKAIQDLLAYHSDIAVDPRVSGAAAKLVEKAKAEEREARTKPAATAEDPLGAYVTQALNAEIISPDAGSAISAMSHENRIHAEFLKRDDIACLAPEKQAALWLKHKEGIAAFANLLSGTPLYGFKSEKKK